MGHVRGGYQRYQRKKKHKTNLPVGAEQSSIFMRCPCARKSRMVGVTGRPPKTALSGRSTSPPDPMPATGKEWVRRLQALTR